MLGSSTYINVLVCKCRLSEGFKLSRKSNEAGKLFSAKEGPQYRMRM